MPDYEVKQPDPDVVGPTGRTIELVCWRDVGLVPPMPNAAVEIYRSNEMKEKHVPALLVDGVDILTELKRARWFSGVGLVFGTFATALALATFILIFLHH